MIEFYAPRPTGTSGPAAALRSGHSDDKVIHRPQTAVLPAEPVEKSAQTGPRPSFRHTYLERVAAFWPYDPEPPVTHVDYEIPEPVTHGPEEPTVDIRR
jgi:hypothetical protein